MRIALGIEYDGTDFLGWQRLSHGPTVQGAVEAALSDIAAEPVQGTCAGRTDAGVHARCQVIHFDTQAQRTMRGWTLGPNSRLPASVAVRWAREVRRRAPEIAAAEGWFSAKVEVTEEGGRVKAVLVPGERATVAAVAFEFRGKINSDRWRRNWDLAIVFGSALPALLWGVAGCNILVAEGPNGALLAQAAKAARTDC